MFVATNVYPPPLTQFSTPGRTTQSKNKTEEVIKLIDCVTAECVELRWVSDHKYS